MQRYQCLYCKHVFVNNNRKSKKDIDIWNQYVYDNKTYRCIQKDTGVSKKTVQRIIDRTEVQNPYTADKEIVVLMDTTYFKRTFGVMVFRDAHEQKNIYWNFVPYETVEKYLLGLDEIRRRGLKIQAVVCDGKRGVFKVLEGKLPVQMCQFHQVQITNRYLTRKPRLEASKELRLIALKLKDSNSTEFKELLNTWHDKWGVFIKERTVDEETGKWHYTHKKVRSAYNSFIKNMELLFTYEKYPLLKIPRTTNGLEGVFSGLKTKVRVHSGLRIDRKQKLISQILKR